MLMATNPKTFTFEVFKMENPVKSFPTVRTKWWKSCLCFLFDRLRSPNAWWRRSSPQSSPGCPPSWSLSSTLSLRCTSTSWRKREQLANMMSWKPQTCHEKLERRWSPWSMRFDLLLLSVRCYLVTDKHFLSSLLVVCLCATLAWEWFPFNQRVITTMLTGINAIFCDTPLLWWFPPST